MPHTLLLELEIEFESPFAAYLKRREVVRGEEFRLSLAATNLGASKFPGAEITNLSVDFRSHGEGQSRWTTSAEVLCPEIEPGKTARFFSDTAVAIDEGTAWLHVKMLARDGAEIEYYQTRTDLLKGVNEWVHHFYVAGRETMQIIALLDQILRELK